MNIFTGSLTFIMIWWLMFFIVLPFMRSGPASEVIAGNDPGAPKVARMKRCMIVTTGVTCALWVVVFLVQYFELFSVRV